jgi:phosphoenolpyruvate synthase/pyruvate phosphate dikinase
VSSISSLSVPTGLSSAITSALEKEFEGEGDWRTKMRFAVRSSAVGEDSDELSAAGQNEVLFDPSSLHFSYCLTPNCFLADVFGLPR